MANKTFLLPTFLLAVLFGCAGHAGRPIADSASSGPATSLLNDPEFTSQEINYFAPNSSTVFLAWETSNFPLEKLIAVNPGTKLNDKLLYTPMAEHGDTFKINLKVPVGAGLHYYFWITKNRQGHYVDFWDLQSSDQVMVEKSAGRILKNAVYAKTKEEKESHALAKGWLLLVILLGVYAWLYIFQKKKYSPRPASPEIERIFFWGLSLMFFHALARAEIIGINPFLFFHDYHVPAKIFRGSLPDFIFIASLVVPFSAVLWLIKNDRIRKVIFGIFAFLALFSTLIAFTNISVVAFLGEPFNYQWLYYSDFLASNEATTAMAANLTPAIFVNLAAICLSVPVLAGILRQVYKLIAGQKRLRQIFLAAGILCFAAVVTLAIRTKATWKTGQTENAIVTMVKSMISANTNSSFFTARLSPESARFNPAQCLTDAKPVISVKSQRVKNVLFIILESAGALYFDGYGGNYHLSPNLNKYASQALMIDQMHAQAPATNRSLVGILGSMYPYLSYKSLTQEAPDIQHTTLSSVLKGKGYRTSFFSSADLRFQNCRQFLAHRNFDRIEDFTDIKCSEEFQLDNSNYNVGNGIDDLCLADRFSSWLDEKPGTNFFSMIWTVQGHYPYFFSGEEEDFGVSNLTLNRYLNCLKHDDELIGRLMESLRERNIDSTTLVVICGDHGEAFGQHGQFGHGDAIYEENLRVPLYFINPVLFHGERKKDLAAMKDLAPTALSVLNIDVPGDWEGRNLLNSTSDEAFYFAPWSAYLFGYRKGNVKYIFNETRNTVEIYDLEKDPNEQTNLSQPADREKIREARSRVSAWVQFQDQYVKKMLKVR